MLAGLPSITAEAVCFARASDERRDPSVRIVHDPYARYFLTPPTRALLAAHELAGRASRLTPAWPALAAYVRTRHRFIDDDLAKALREDAVEQLVVLGAGYDSRAWRFAEPLAGRPVFEVDFPSTGRQKNRIAGSLHDLPDVDRRVVAIDFETQSLAERLAAAGFEVGRPTYFVWEGVSMYLTRSALKETLTVLTELGGSGSRLSMDYLRLDDEPTLRGTYHRNVGGLLSLLGEPTTLFIHPEDATTMMQGCGWTVDDLADASELEQRYVRDRQHVHRTAFVLSAETR
jgi:methyltransferase (TIGR00027 family)